MTSKIAVYLVAAVALAATNPTLLHAAKSCCEAACCSLGCC